MQMQSATYSTFTAITKSDTTQISCRAIYVGGAGNITISQDGVTAGVVITAPPVGSIIPIQLDCGRILAATTATALVALA